MSSTTASAMAPVYLYCSSSVIMTSGAISDLRGMLLEMKITEPYSPTARANASANPVMTVGKKRRCNDADKCAQPPGAQRRGHFLDLPLHAFQHRLQRAHHKRQPHKGERDHHA